MSFDKNNIDQGLLLLLKKQIKNSGGEAPVTSVNGQTGDVTIPIPDVSEFVTEEEAAAAAPVQSVTGPRGVTTNPSTGVVTVTIPDTSGFVTSVNGQAGDVTVDELPMPESSDEGKVLTARSGSAVWEEGSGGGGTFDSSNLVHLTQYGTRINPAAGEVVDLNDIKGDTAPYTAREYYFTGNSIPTDIIDGTKVPRIKNLPKRVSAQFRLFVFAGGNSNYSVQMLMPSYGSRDKGLHIRAET